MPSTFAHILNTRIKFLDVHKIFSNKTVKDFLKAIEVDYHGEGLDEVAREYIGRVNIISHPCLKELFPR